MSEENTESRNATLNPVYLKAVRDEAVSRKPGETHHSETPNPGSARAARPMAHAEAGRAAGETPDIPIQTVHPGDGRNRDNPQSATAGTELSAAISHNQGEIARIRREIEKITRANQADSGCAIESLQAELNQLRLKRLAIQMALVSDNDRRTDGELVAMDRRIAELLRSMAQARDAARAQTGPAVESNGMIDGLRRRLETLVEQTRLLAVEQTRRVVTRKAREYVLALQAANRLRHDLLALAALAPEGALPGDIDLSGEFPFPKGLDAFVSINRGDLGVAGQEIETAKERVRSELAPAWPTDRD